MTTCKATITLPDGSTKTYTRHGTTAQFVVYGLDAVGVRRCELPGVAQWCANERGAQNVLPNWTKYGGQWLILPVTYTS